ncbi:hypothetical protein LAZ67_15000289 [Cordylochernes scorpioides]|uniref:Integrase catalytic domain-containing protein n=1 Tax=Cordylochernes scorpioides TaxID=51811 RepID=A0ABY6LAG6_9ARAC|nr:hypothetical protein LAZ67_15000289 [Cordylochernes scorpioides]
MIRLIPAEYYWKSMSKYIAQRSYLHVAVDYLTRYVWTVESMKTSIRNYQQVIKQVLQDGTPKRLFTDRAPAFTSPKFRRLSINKNIHPITTTSNNPKAKGLCERLNATPTGKFRLLYLENPKVEWTKTITRVMTAQQVAHSYQDSSKPFNKFLENERFKLQNEGFKLQNEGFKLQNPRRVESDINDIRMFKDAAWLTAILGAGSSREDLLELMPLNPAPPRPTVLELTLRHQIQLVPARQVLGAQRVQRLEPTKVIDAQRNFFGFASHREHLKE